MTRRLPARRATLLLVVTVFVTAVVTVATVAALLVPTAAAPTAAADVSEPREHPPRAVERVLIVSLPLVSWEDLENVRIPNLNRLLDESAIAGLTTRTIASARDVASGYVTLGAGTRASGSESPSDGAAFDVGEPFGSATAASAFEQRTGQTSDRGLVHLGIAPIVEANDAVHLDAEIGALGDALAAAGYSRAVVANGDGTVPGTVDPVYEREAVAALMGSDGTVPDGRVDESLLERDPDAPFGERMDLGATADAFRAAWKPRSVVLVESSDLVRARTYSQYVSEPQSTAMFREALYRSDALVGRLLRDVDARRDAVLVVGPAPQVGGGTITVVALRAPGTTSGLLRSASTSRAGFVQLVDIAPSVLDVLGLERSKEMRGRPFSIVSTDADPREGREFLVGESTAARFRAQTLTRVYIAFIVLQALLALGAVWVLTRSGGVRARAWLRVGATFSLGFVPTVYLARLVPLHDAGAIAYTGFLAAGAIALGTAYRVIGRRDPLDPVILGLAVIIAVLAGDVTFGSNLHLSNPFGYSPGFGIRFIGFGNVSYAFLASSSVLLAGLLAHRIGGRRGAWTGVAILVFAIVVDGSPFWGADVGGALSLIPAFALTAALLLGVRVRARVRTAVVGVAVMLIGAAALVAIDLARPPGRRTHLGRLVEQVQSDGWEVLTGVIGNKIDQNLGSFTRSIWGLLLPLVIGFVIYLALSSRRWLSSLTRRIPELRAALIGFAAAAVLGYALNDSGIDVPGVMLAVLNTVLVALLFPARQADNAPAGHGTTVRSMRRQLVA
jgi:hypothetical protein